MATRFDHGDVEAEPVVVDTDQPDVVVIELDDGGRLELDVDELREVLEAA